MFDRQGSARTLAAAVRAVVASATIWIASVGDGHAQLAALERDLAAPEWTGPGICNMLPFEGTTYIVCEIDTRKYVVRTYWRDPAGVRYGKLRPLVRKLRQQGQALAFAMNGGMYKADFSPLGLYIENGREISPASTSSGAGNFYLKPNGVFFVDGQRVGIAETSKFLQQKTKADFATQSGPLILADGVIHPRISSTGTSRFIRNGVGIKDQHTAVFVISLKRVTFSEFARVFRDGLGCADALYLDGKVSGIYARRTYLSNRILPVGPFIAAHPRTQAIAAP